MPASALWLRAKNAKGEDTLPLIRSAISALLVLLSGCATPYAEPSGGDRARVRFVVERRSPVPNQTLLDAPRAFVFIYDDNQCSNERQVAFIQDSSFLAGDHRDLQMPLGGAYGNAASETYMPAGREVNIMLVGHANAFDGLRNVEYSCGVFLNLTFENGHDYELVFRREGTRCSVEQSEIFSTPSGFERRTMKIISAVLREGCARVFMSH